MIFADLSYGPDVTVEHVHPAFSPLPVQVAEGVVGGEPVEVTATDADSADAILYPDEPEGATVTLYPGDIVTIDHEYAEHAYLQPLDVVAKKATVEDIKADLTERGIDFDPKAKKADLEALLAPHLPVITDDGINGGQAASNPEGA